MSKVILRVCDGCSKKTDEIEQMTCCASQVDLYDFGSNENGCFDDQFYCKECLNEEGFCKICAKRIPLEVQKKVGKYLDTGSCTWKKK